MYIYVYVYVYIYIYICIHIHICIHILYAWLIHWLGRCMYALWPDPMNKHCSNPRVIGDADLNMSCECSKSQGVGLIFSDLCFENWRCSQASAEGTRFVVLDVFAALQLGNSKVSIDARHVTHIVWLRRIAMLLLLRFVRGAVVLLRLVGLTLVFDWTL